MPAITIQFSLYPLKLPDPWPVMEQALDAAQATGVSADVGRMSSMIEGSQEQVFAALQAAFAATSAHGEVVLVATISNAC